MLTLEQTPAWFALESAMGWPPAVLNAQLRRDADLSAQLRRDADLSVEVS